MAEVGDFLLICLLTNVFEKSRLIVPSQLLEAPVPEFRIMVCVQILVIARVQVAASVVRPNFKASLSKEECNRIWTLMHRKLAGVIQAMLHDKNRSFGPLVVLKSGTSGSWYAKCAVYVVISCAVVVSFNFVSVSLCCAHKVFVAIAMSQCLATAGQPQESHFMALIILFTSSKK